MTPSPHPTARLLPATALSTSVALCAVLFVGCTAASPTAEENVSPGATEAFSGADGVSTVQAVLDANDDQTVVNDDEWSEDDAVDIVLGETGAESTSSNVVSSNGTVSITAAGVYRISGEFTGTLSVDAPEDALVVLILDDVTLSATDAPAIQVVTADDVVLHLAAGSTNTVTSSGSYAEDADANAAIWADADLTVSGTGALTIIGQANDGITSKDDLVVLSGSLTVDAADDGLRGKDSLTIRGGDITVDAGGDGLNSDQDDDETRGWILIEDGVVSVTAGSDGLDGFTDVVIAGGAVTVAAEEGIEAGIVAISGGTIDIVSSDDGINGSAGKADETSTAVDTDAGAAPDGEARPGTGDEDTSAGGSGPGEGGTGGMRGGAQGGGAGDGMADSGELVLIEGGEITIDAEGDGLDSNGAVLITGGTTVVFGPTSSGNGALDANGEFRIEGGTLIALGSAGMAETPAAESAQAWVAAEASGSTGTVVTLTDEDGTALYEIEAVKEFATVVFSSDAVTAGNSYTIAVDGTASATVPTGEALQQRGGFGG